MTRQAARTRPEVATRPETYGEWLRRQPIEGLSSDEVQRLLEEREWERRNPIVVARFEAFVGATVRLKRAMTTWHSECGPAESATAVDVRGATKRVTRGTRFYIRARWGDRLLGLERVSGEAYLLSGDWVELVETSE